MKVYRVNVKVPVQVSWEQEIVEEDASFFLRLTPHVDTNAKGAARLKRISVNMGEGVFETRYKTVRRINYENFLQKQRAELEKKKEELKKKIAEDQKKDIKEMVVKSANGKGITAKVQTSAPLSTSKPAYDIDKMLAGISKEDYEAAGYKKYSGEDKRPLTVGFTEKEIEQLTKNKG